MKSLLSILVMLILVSPLCAGVILSEDFEAGTATNPIVDGVSGWSNTPGALPSHKYSDFTIDSGLSAADGSSAWSYEHLAFDHTPVAGEVYTLSAVMYSPVAQYIGNVEDASYTSLRIDEANDTDTGLGSCAIDIGDNVLAYWLPGGGITAPHPGDQVMDVKMDLSTAKIDCFYRVHGTETWTLAGTGAGVDISLFDEVTMCMLGGNPYAHISNIDTILLTSEVIPPDDPTPGDANKDGKVDGSDVTILAGNWQVLVDATWEMGDFNGDHKVDGSDVTILAGNWQAGVITAAASVPEPSTMVLLALLAGMLAVVRTVRHRN